MPDGRHKVPVRTVFGRPAQLSVRAADGFVVMDPPPPGPFMLDPTTDLPYFRHVLDIAEEQALQQREPPRGEP